MHILILFPDAVTLTVIIRDDCKSILQIIFIIIVAFWTNYLVGRFLMLSLIGSFLALVEPLIYFVRVSLNETR